MGTAGQRTGSGPTPPAGRGPPPTTRRRPAEDPATGLYTGRRPGLTLVDRLLATILYQRFKIPQVVIAPLFTITPVTLNRAISQTRRLLHDIGHAIEPAETQLATLDDLTDLAAHLGITPTSEIKTAS